MLKYRLIFGTLMVLAFAGLLVLDGYIDGSLSSAAENKPIQGTILCIIIALLAFPAQLEIAKLAENIGAVIFKPITIIASILLTTAWYVRQFAAETGSFHLFYTLFVSAFSLLALFIFQARKFGTKGTIVNCSVSFFSIFYLGFLSSFVLAVRIEFGLWALLMFIFVVKSSDIGAYTIGRLFGKHKFSPTISPGKTWEGLAGAVAFAIGVSSLFAHFTGLMNWWQAVLFGGIFAYLGQLGDLAESMIKRDAEMKDSSTSVPGFGGVLDIIDSPLVTAPLAYGFMLLAMK